MGNFKIYKPFGYLSQFINNQTRRVNKKLLGDLFDFPEGIMAIGRLDEDSEGLLLLTSDGVISETVRSKSIEKEYYVQVDGQITPEAIQRLRTGVGIGVSGSEYVTMPCNAVILETSPTLPERAKKIRDSRHGRTSWISVTLTEGKFRQVKKMTAAVGFPTLRLVRVRIGSENLGTMKPGDVLVIAEFNLENVL